MNGNFEISMCLSFICVLIRAVRVPLATGQEFSNQRQDASGTMATLMSATSVLVTWLEPAAGNATVQRYRVEAVQLGSSQVLPVNGSGSTFITDSWTFQRRFDGLAESSAYTFVVTPWTLAGPMASVYTSVVFTYYSELCPTVAGTFDADMQGYRQSRSHDVDWVWQRSFSGRAGPVRDHTSGTGRYVVIDASRRSLSERKAVLISPAYPAFKYYTCSFEFWYHTNGLAVDSLSVYQVADDSSTTMLWTLNGTQSDGWRVAVVDLQPVEIDTTFSIAFEGVVRPLHVGAIAIDDVQFDSSCCLSRHADVVDVNTSTATLPGSRIDTGAELYIIISLSGIIGMFILAVAALLAALRRRRRDIKLLKPRRGRTMSTEPLDNMSPLSPEIDTQFRYETGGGVSANGGAMWLSASPLPQERSTAYTDFTCTYLSDAVTAASADSKSESIPVVLTTNAAYGKTEHERQQLDGDYVLGSPSGAAAYSRAEEAAAGEAREDEYLVPRRDSLLPPQARPRTASRADSYRPPSVACSTASTPSTMQRGVELRAGGTDGEPSGSDIARAHRAVERVVSQGQAKSCVRSSPLLDQPKRNTNAAAEETDSGRISPVEAEYMAMANPTARDPYQQSASDEPEYPDDNALRLDMKAKGILPESTRCVYADVRITTPELTGVKA